MSGWYPDPGGEPNRYRYWDGTRWSQQTSSDPSQSPPSGGTATPRRLPVAPLVVVAVVAMIIFVTFWLIRGAGSGRPYTDDPLPSTRVSGWDDSSPLPSPVAPSPSAASPRGGGLCVRGQPNTRDYAPADGRVHGGRLSFPAAPELDPAGDEPRFSFAWDVSQQIRGVHDQPGWIAQLAVGRLRAADGFDDGARRVAEQAVRCTITSNMYEPYGPTRKDRRSESIMVDGQRGWLIETDITVEVRGLPFGGDRVHLIVIPDGDDFSFFFSAVPIGDEALIAVADRTQRALTIS